MAVAVSALLTSWWTGHDVLTVNLSQPEACAQLKAGLPEGSAEIHVESTEAGCALHLPGASAWRSRPEWLGELLRLAGIKDAQQADLDRLMDRLVREGRVVQAHLHPASTKALTRVQDEVDDFNRNVGSSSSCACAYAALEQSRGWVGWSIRPTGNCGNGLLEGDAPAWCPESARHGPMMAGVAGVFTVGLALVVRRALKRRAARAATAAGSASP